MKEEKFKGMQRKQKKRWEVEKLWSFDIYYGGAV